jgi:phosphatidylglycerol:prolipoprotein diacylglycerol transferase
MLQQLALTFPQLDPVAISIGPIALRWYALAYMAGLLLAWWYCRRIARRPESVVKLEVIDDLIAWATLGVVLGGRLGYILFYKPGYYLANPEQIVFLWEGGMSFHGGLLGVLLAIGWVARRHGLRYFQLADIVGCATPIGLFLGRLANFVNGELYGRVSDVPWAMVFPNGGPEPRHPSQLYQAFLEGLCVFVLLWIFLRAGRLRQVGFLSGLFLVGYGMARIIGEVFREPDAHLGFILGPVTMGQLLSLPMVAIGIWFMVRALRQAPTAVPAAAPQSPARGVKKRK